ncbi:uncharacterized protein LOC143680653 isoform X2 [Tamandua tetradactyla]|uniref:uncharacterized protein LOC143680653 isoform X2 n=1 Tax=Tamandua tetradactyla TaxID=48850 RepID=UPI004053F341
MKRYRGDPSLTCLYKLCICSMVHFYQRTACYAKDIEIDSCIFGVRHPGCNANTWKSLENKDLEFTFRENKGLDGSTHSYLKGIWMDTLHLRLKTLK